MPLRWRFLWTARKPSLSLSGSAAGSGSLDDPYTGNAGYSITTTTSTSGEVEQDVAILAGESHPP